MRRVGGIDLCLVIVELRKVFRSSNNVYCIMKTNFLIFTVNVPFVFSEWKIFYWINQNWKYLIRKLAKTINEFIKISNELSNVESIYCLLLILSCDYLSGGSAVPVHFDSGTQPFSRLPSPNFPHRKTAMKM